MAKEQLEAVRQMKIRRPFAPFRIVTTGGDKYLVEDRFQFAIGATKLMYVFPRSDRFIELTADKIAGVEMIQQSAA